MEHDNNIQCYIEKSKVNSYSFISGEKESEILLIKVTMKTILLINISSIFAYKINIAAQRLDV